MQHIINFNELKEAALEYKISADGQPVTPEAKDAVVQRWADEAVAYHVNQILAAAKNAVPAPTPEEIAAKKVAEETAAKEYVEAFKAACCARMEAEVAAAEAAIEVKP